MPGARILVLTTVHRSDDTRIREKLIPVLARLGEVTYATRAPAPTDPHGLSWRELRGGRLRRNLTASALVWRGSWDLVVVHDPELLPPAIAASRLRRASVVVDVHEDVPAQLATKRWLPRPLRWPAARVAAFLLRVAERSCEITLAEANYAHLFRRAHPTFPNYPAALPAPADSDGSVVYVGDVTEDRGVLDVAHALARVDPHRAFHVIGPCRDEMRKQLEGSGAAVRIHGPLPHGTAMARMAGAEVAVAPLRDLPNYRHSLPTKVLEYLGTGVAVIATDLPGTAAALGGRPGVRLVPPGDVAAWGEALLAACDGELRRAARRGIAEIRAAYSWPTAEVAAFYEEVLSSGRPGGAAR